MINKLKKEFTGKGEVSGFEFNQISSNKNAYLYQVNDNHFEVFKKKITPICVDFEKKIYSETEFKEVYPKASQFGISAWTFRDKQLAFNKLNSI